jgi:hypothetical protein
MPRLAQQLSISRRHRGRPRRPPISEWSNNLNQHIDDTGVTVQNAARELEIAPSTLGRVISGHTKRPQYSWEKFCQAMNIPEQTRRDLFAYAVAAGITFVTRGVGGGDDPPYTPTPQTAASTFDLDLIDERARAVEAELAAGGRAATDILREAEDWFARLLRNDHSKRPSASDPRVGKTQIAWGKVVLLAQQAALPWDTRAVQATRTCERIEEVMRLFPLRMLARERAALFEQEIVL